MTEDEAFIRTIVDSPGDDLPRLVYADWLDERSDPRGAYLRAELEWAKAKQTTGFIVLRLNGLAEGLDPVWVARVSRPPVGVCCDPNVFKWSGPRLTDSDISKVEAKIGLAITGEYRAFMLNVNGGVLRTPYPTFNEDCFYSIEPDKQNTVDYSFDYQTGTFRDTLPQILAHPVYDLELAPSQTEWREDAVPIGNNNVFTLFYAVRGEFAGRLQLQDRSDDWRSFGLFAGSFGPPTFSEYLHRLVEYDRGILDTYPTQPLQEFWRR